MKTPSRLIPVILFVIASILANGQDVGRVIIKNQKDAFPKFIVSLNGVRLTNEYQSTVTFNYLDEYQYKVNILQAGSRNTLSFMVYSSPNYISTYIISKDAYGNYLFNQESKTLMSDTGAVASNTTVSPKGHTTAATPTNTTSAAATTTAATGAVIDEGEYFDIIKTLKKETIEKNRLEMAKTFFGNKWLLASMVKHSLGIFNLEASRVAYAKFAYARTVDKQNYYMVFDAFTLSNSKKEMTEYIKVNP
jgi:hypothetical protein